MMLIKRLFFHFALYIYLHQGLITGKANGFMLIEKNISFSLSHHHHNNEKQQHDNVVYSTGTSTPRNHQQPVGACDGMNRSKNPNSCKTTLHMSTISDEQFEKISPRKLVQLGMLYFKQGDVDGSITLFDKAEKRDETLSPYLWQRGISYYYADRFQDGSDQFRYDVKVNPLDVEEIVWDIACQYNILSSTNRNDGSKEDAVINMMSLPKGKTDRRKIMSTVYSLFRGDGSTEHDLVNAGHTGSVSDEFYSLFYLGLWCEAKGESIKAENYMRAAVKSPYGQGSNDFMTDVAKVHCKTRGWGY